MTILRAGESEFHNLAAGQVLTVIASPASAGLVRQYRADSGFATTGITPVGTGATVTVGPFTGTVRLGVECTVGVLEWDSGPAAPAPLVPPVSGDGGATNLGATASPTGVTVTSDTGSDATLPLADGTNAGLMAPAQHTKLAGIAAGATANATDAQLRDRATHTGTQAASTISDFSATVSAHPRTIKGPHTYAEMLALSTVGFTAGATHVYVNSPAERIGLYVWDGTRYHKESASIVSAERAFGIRPGAGVDNTAAFAALCSWMAGLSDSGHYVIDFGPGDFYTDHITTLKPASGSVSATVLLVGVPGQTNFVARPSSQPVFFTLVAAYQYCTSISGIRLQGIGATNPHQDGFAVIADPRSLDNTGGVSFGQFRYLHIRGFHGKAAWMRGGLFDNGRWGWKLPNQHLEIFQCNLESDFDSSLEVYGQFGQIGIQGGAFDGAQSGGGRGTVPGCGAFIGVDYRNLSNQISSVTGNKFQLANVFAAPGGTPVRVIGTNLATPLATGTTYWAWPVDLHDSASEGRLICLSASRANAGTKTAITITGAGTPANYRLVWLWATGAPVGNEFTTEFNHRLCTGDKLHLEGSNVPTGTVARTTYWVIRTGHRTFRLASSEDNATNGVAMSVSGGTAANYGFVLNDYNKGSAEMVGAYSVDMRTTTQGRNEGIVVNGSWDVRLNLHVENMINPVRVINSVVSINEGSYQDAAYGIGGEGVLWAVAGANSRLSVYGGVSVVGIAERLVSNMGNSAGGVVWMHGANITGPNGWTPPSVQTVGIARQVGVEAGGVINTGAAADVFVNGSATTINTINSTLSFGRELVLMAFGGSITLGNAGNIRMPGTTRVIPENGVAVLRRWDTVATWLLVAVVS